MERHVSYTAPIDFSDVTVSCKANIYFEGKVISHSITFQDGSRKTLGLIYPGNYKFETAAAEVMEIIAGECRVRIADQDSWQEFSAGTFFEVPENSSFTIEVAEETTEYVCSFK